MRTLLKVPRQVILFNEKKNLIAKDLLTPKYKIRVVKPKKGKGSFTRKTNGKKNIIEKMDS